MTNDEKANKIARDMLPYNNAEYHACYNSAMKAMQWKDEQFAKEKQQLIDEACKWLEVKVNDSYAKPTYLQVDRLREHLNNIK